MLLRFPITAPWQQVLSEPLSPVSDPTGISIVRIICRRWPLGDVPAYGHTHIPVAEKRGAIYLFNPGSVSIPKGEYSASYGLLDQGGCRF
ncbi:metallophosphoesterase family protein [Klebsiella pneumoniae subsp. pneumoniae]|nr:metallophosphoesterase family protein [Klebsiella pneumoniae subsp. pneumoniae]